MEGKKVRKKLNKKALLVIILTLYLIIMAFYYFLTLPIKNIIVTGNNLVSDTTIINAAGISDYPHIFRTSTKKMTDNIQNLDFIASVEIKKSITGTVTINVTEEKVLFYNVLNSSFVLASGKEVKQEEAPILGLPTLVNYVPSDIYEELITSMSNIDFDIISLISEIEYSPDIKEDVTINDSRFILRMNDGNYVYIDIVNFANLNKYKIIYSSLDKKGILHLDGVYLDSDTVVFTAFDALREEVGDEGELSE